MLQPSRSSTAPEGRTPTCAWIEQRIRTGGRALDGRAVSGAVARSMGLLWRGSLAGGCRVVRWGDSSRPAIEPRRAPAPGKHRSQICVLVKASRTTIETVKAGLAASTLGRRVRRWGGREGRPALERGLTGVVPWSGERAAAAFPAVVRAGEQRTQGGHSLLGGRATPTCAASEPSGRAVEMAQAGLDGQQLLSELEMAREAVQSSAPNRMVSLTVL